MSKIFHIFFASLLLVVLTGCEKFTGYNFDAEPVDNSVQISGKIINRFTHRPVEGARVRIGAQETSTDIQGEFLLFYALGPDEERNKPVPIEVTAKNYFPYQTEKIIFPEPLKLDVSLTYAAPIIKKVVLPFYPEALGGVYVCQALILDYQGMADIDSAAVLINYHILSQPGLLGVRTTMDFVESVSDSEGFFQAIVSPQIGGQWVIYRRHELYAFNSHGLSDTLKFQLSPSIPDTFLFPPVIPGIGGVR